MLKLTVVLALLCVCLCAPQHSYYKQKHLAAENVSEDAVAHWFNSQLVDHFDKTNTDVWAQKFYVNDTYYAPGGPVLFFLGGEGPESPRTLGGAFYINTFAKELGALMVAIEHRYYGESMPVDELTNEKMVYLSSAQALADFATFRDWFPTAYSMYSTTEDAAWIAIGGSYSGSLAAWLRLRYPHLIAGALGSSAPVEATVDYHQYYDVVQDSLRTSSYGNQCPEAMAEAIAMVEDMLGRMSGRTELTRYFNLCEDIDMDNPIDISSFMSMLDDPVAGTVQYASPGDIENLCHDLIEGPFGDNYMRNLAILVRELYFGGCTDASYQSFVDYMTVTDITAESASSRSWFYQCCTEFSYWQTGTTSTSASDMVDLDYYHAWCADAYDIDAEAADFQTAQTNVLYGGDEPRISNVFYANGSIDPWHAISNLHFDNPASPHVLMTGTSHCQDMYATADNDVAPLAATRDMQLQSMKAWVKEWVA